MGKKGGIVSDVSTKYFLQIWSGAQAVMKLRPGFIAGPPQKDNLFHDQQLSKLLDTGR